MPAAAQHLEQYRRNKAFFEALFSYKPEQPEWMMTVAFYCAVHLVESWLASLSSPIHNESHNDRMSCMDRVPELKRVRKPYIELEKDSRSARYGCVRFTFKHAEAARTRLSEIEAALLPPG